MLAESKDLWGLIFGIVSVLEARVQRIKTSSPVPNHITLKYFKLSVL